MPQPIKKIVKDSLPNGGKKKRKKLETTKAARIRAFKKKIKGNQEYGTSKLEERFARDFLDKLGIEYIYQYEMGSIKRFLDFYIPEIKVALEIDGDFYHSYGLVYEQMNPMQKHNYKVDRIKDSWCKNNGVFLIRLWEHDINNNPERVLSYLKEVLKPYLDKKNSNKDKRLKN